MSFPAKCPIIIETIGLLRRLFLLLPLPNKPNKLCTPPPATTLRNPEATVLVASATTSLFFSFGTSGLLMTVSDALPFTRSNNSFNMI
jgi:hypothetical protein